MRPWLYYHRYVCYCPNLLNGSHAAFKMESYRHSPNEPIALLLMLEENGEKLGKFYWLRETELNARH